MNLKNYSTGLFLVCGLILILVGVPRLVLDSWIIYSEYLFFAALVLFLLATAFSYKSILEFFTMRTTKYGMNMGTLIVLGMVLYFCFNLFAFRYDKSIDITSSKLNSLSLQSLEILDSLKEDVEFRVYFQGKAHVNQNMALKGLFKKYTRESSKIKSKFIDAHKDPESVKYLTRADQGKMVLFVKQGERKERVKVPVSEESLTSALFRLAQTDARKIYFLTGHGERSINTSAVSGVGVSMLADSLRGKGLSVDELNLLQAQKVPKDAAMVAILGPKKSLLKREVLTLKEYLIDGGRLLLASDPSQKSNLNEISRMVGIRNENNYLLATQTVAGADAMSVIGQEFDLKNPITEKMDKNAITLFYEASGLKREKTKFDVSAMVLTPEIVIPVQSLTSYKAEIKDKKPIRAVVAMTAKGSFGLEKHKGHDHSSEEQDAFSVAVFGDSDFLTDIYLDTGFNRDLALNTFAQLAGQVNLVSIRPRKANDTKLVLTKSKSAFVVIFPILIPLILLIIATILWFRKRGA